MASKFSQQHYVAIADAIKQYNPMGEMNYILRDVVREFDRMFRADNSKYDSDKFLRRCGCQDIEL